MDGSYQNSRAPSLGEGDAFLIKACTIFQDCVTIFGRKVSAVDNLSASYGSQRDAEELLISIRQVRSEWRAIARGLIETPAHHPLATQAKVDAVHAYFTHVDCAVECIGLDLARSLVSDLKNARDR